MKKVILFLFLSAATIWACTKESTPTPPSAPTTSDNTTLEERSTKVNFVNVSNFRLCGVPPDANVCQLCSGTQSGYMDFTGSSQLVNLPGSEFCLTNNNSFDVTVTVNVSGCLVSYNFKILAGTRVCFTISGCVISTC